MLLVLKLFCVAANSQPAVNLSRIGNAETVINQQTQFYTSDSFISFINLPHLAFNKILTGKNYVSTGFINKHYYFKTRLVNNTTQPVTVRYVMKNNSVPLATLIEQKTDSSLSVKKFMGTDIPFKNWQTPISVFNYALHFKPGEEKTIFFYAHVRKMQLQFNLFLVTEPAFEKLKNRVFWVAGIFTGIFLLVFFLSLYEFFITRDTLHIMYAVYVLSNLMLFLSINGVDMQFLYSGTATIGRISRIGYGAFSSYLLAAIMVRFFNLNRQSFNWYYPLQAIKYTFLFLLFLHLFVELVYTNYHLIKFKYLTYILAGVLGHATILISTILLIRRKVPAALFYLAAEIGIFAGGLFTFLNFSGVTQFNLPFPTWLEYGMLAETIIISFGINYRYNLYKKQKEQLQLELQQKENSLKTQLLQVQETEQKRIAQDLHDDLGGNLAAIKLKLQSIDLPPETITPLLLQLDKTSETARNIAHNLMPPGFENTPLPVLLQNFFDALNNNDKAQFQFYCSGYKTVFTKKQELIIYRIIIELANNILKHAQAKNATIQLVYYSAHIIIMAEDNGKGFNKNGKQGTGLNNILHRTQFLNGNMHIDSTQGGTTITINIPVHATA